MTYKNEDSYRGKKSRPIRYYQDRTAEAMPPPMTAEESTEAEDSMERIARMRFVRRYERRMMVLIIRALLAEIRRLEAELAKFQPCDLTDYKRDGLDYPTHTRTVYHREGER
ncbi:MAG: hypothetical protein M0Z92_09345 [Actinomycetota bacterium]|nr:hypothetical protein [Actinomycetota bacterium]